jgi:G3E family GTPase
LPKTPVALVTGFLGSGKTTLISRLLAHPDMGETAVIVNELGEVGIDHHLLRRVDERTVLLPSGCLCCTLRGDLADELRDLYDRRARSEIPAFSRVVVETTGLADPAPVAYTLAAEPVVRHHFELETIVATVDSVHGLRELESIKQAAIADVLVVTKVDAAPADEVEATLRSLNPAADIVEATFGDVEPAALFGRPQRDPRELQLDGGPEHHHGVEAVCLFLDEVLDWTAFGIWLTMLLQARGQDILRVKGLLNVGGKGPLLLNGVQHVVHPPEHLDAWPDDDRRSRIVFIGRGFEPGALEASLAAFNGAAGRPPGAERSARPAPPAAGRP